MLGFLTTAFVLCLLLQLRPCRHRRSLERPTQNCPTDPPSMRPPHADFAVPLGRTCGARRVPAENSTRCALRFRMIPVHFQRLFQEYVEVVIAVQWNPKPKHLTETDKEVKLHRVSPSPFSFSPFFWVRHFTSVHPNFAHDTHEKRKKHDKMNTK